MLARLTGRNLVILVLVAIASLTIYSYLTSRAFIKLRVDSGETPLFRIYWKSDDQPNYTDAQSKIIQIYPQKHNYAAPLADFSNVDSLRIDPTTSEGYFRITEISIYQSGFGPARIFGKALDDLKALQGVALISRDKKGLVYKPSGWDSQFEYRFKFLPENDTLWTAIWQCSLLALALWLLVQYFPRVARDYQFVPYAMMLIMGLITTMAIISRPHAHPDEHAHLQAALYFENTNTLPAACEKDTLKTYTNYGTSRLNTDEITYYLAGKYLKLLDIVPTDFYLKLRSFNLLLFAILLGIAITRPAARLLFLPVLISPQVWYLFSYFNSDAFALFTALLVGYQVACPNTLFRRLITSEQLARFWPALLGLGLLFSLVLITKKNYYFFTLFLLGAAGVFAWQYRNQRAVLAQAGKPIALVAVGAAALFSLWVASLHAIYPNDREAAIMECREQTAETKYKPSTPIEDKYWSLSLDERDIDILTMIGYGWPKQVFKSMFGNYAYVALPGSPLYYQILATLLSVLCLYLIYAAIRFGNNTQRLLLLGAGALFAALVAITIYKSWTVDYQPQGRYYFAMIPILGTLMAWMRSSVNPLVLTPIIAAMMSLGIYSFITIALLEITKYTL